MESTFANLTPDQVMLLINLAVADDRVHWHRGLLEAMRQQEESWRECKEQVQVDLEEAHKHYQRIRDRAFAEIPNVRFYSQEDQ